MAKRMGEGGKQETDLGIVKGRDRAGAVVARGLDGDVLVGIKVDTGVLVAAKESVGLLRVEGRVLGAEFGKIPSGCHGKGSRGIETCIKSL